MRLKKRIEKLEQEMQQTVKQKPFCYIEVSSDGYEVTLRENGEDLFVSYFGYMSGAHVPLEYYYEPRFNLLVLAERLKNKPQKFYVFFKCNSKFEITHTDILDYEKIYFKNIVVKGDADDTRD